MATKKKTKIEMRTDGLPMIEQYDGLPEKNDCQNDCLVFDKQGQIFRFKSASRCTIVAAGIDHKVEGFSKYADITTTAEALAMHTTLFAFEAPKVICDKESEYIYLKLACWKGLCMKAADRTAKPVAIDHKTGEPKGRKLANRKYVLVKDDWTGITIPQAMACLRIIKDNVAPDGEGVVGSVSEESLKSLVNVRREELKTRQDPWRIFQYYRPQLIAAGILRLV